MSRHASTSLGSFMRAAELGSFAAAGRVLGISAAAVGQNVKRLEDDYGVKLFNRTTRKMSLTAEGSLLFQRARDPLRELDEIDHLFNEARGLVSGPLRITAPKRLAYRTVIPLVSEFHEAHPKVEIDIDASDNVRDLVDDPVDLGFRIGAPSDSTMIARPLSKLPVYTLAAPSYLEKHGEPTHPQDLSDHECIQYRFPSSGEKWLWAFNIDGEPKRMATQGAFMFNDPEVILAAGREGLGVFQMDGYYAGDDVRAGLLKPIMTQFAADLQSLYLCYPSRENLPLRVRAFIDFVLSRIKKDCFAMSDCI
ncbi:MAG: LysR family transcriptional regulator [Pseudomonadota bacterium]